MVLSQMTDEELMGLYKTGSDAAFKILYGRHSGKVFGYLKRRIYSQAVCHEVFQEVFLKLHSSKQSYKDHLPFLPWLFTITNSVLVDQFRKDKRNMETAWEDLDVLESPQEKNTDAVELLGSMLGELDERSGQAMKMRFLSDNSFEEIATILKTSPANVRQLLSRAIRKIRNLGRYKL